MWAADFGISKAAFKVKRKKTSLFNFYFTFDNKLEGKKRTFVS